MSDANTFFENYKKQTQEMRDTAPELCKSFGGLFLTVMKDGALTIKIKELIAIGIALNEMCEPCIRLHIKKAVEAGATDEEIIEAASVAIVMRGGPAYTHFPLVIETLQDIRQK